MTIDIMKASAIGSALDKLEIPEQHPFDTICHCLKNIEDASSLLYTLGFEEEQKAGIIRSNCAIIKESVLSLMNSHSL